MANTTQYRIEDYEYADGRHMYWLAEKAFLGWDTIGSFNTMEEVKKYIARHTLVNKTTTYETP